MQLYNITAMDENERETTDNVMNRQSTVAISNVTSICDRAILLSTENMFHLINTFLTIVDPHGGAEKHVIGHCV